MLTLVPPEYEVFGGGKWKKLTGKKVLLFASLGLEKHSPRSELLIRDYLGCFLALPEGGGAS